MDVQVTPYPATDTEHYPGITTYPWCEWQGFPYDITVVQTVQGDISNLAILSFPEAYFDFYCGNWKKGLVFSQKNLNGIKDGIDVDGDGTLDGPNNGWQQFALTGSPDEMVIPVGEEFIRTWSHGTSYVIPKLVYEDTSETDQTKKIKTVDILKCYRATNYVYGGEVTLKQIPNNIPANTGMIIRSTGAYQQYMGGLSKGFWDRLRGILKALSFMQPFNLNLRKPA